MYNYRYSLSQKGMHSEHSKIGKRQVKDTKGIRNFVDQTSN